jgi:hypothetical protein
MIEKTVHTAKHTVKAVVLKPRICPDLPFAVACIAAGPSSCVAGTGKISGRSQADGRAHAPLL